MSRIILKQTSIVITDYKLGDQPVLEEYFTQYDKITHSFYIQGMKYIEDEFKLILPRGLDIYFLEGLFETKAEYDRSYDRYIESEVNLKYLPRDDIQKEALRFILGVNEYSNTANSSQLCVNLNTGAGKTYVSIAATAAMGVKPLVIASTVEWINQWRERYLEYTDITPSEILILQGANSINSIFTGLTDLNRYKVFLATHGTIKSYGDRYGWDKIGELFRKLQIGLKIFDEAHLNFDNLADIDFFTNTYKTLYLTATPARSSIQENIIYQLYFKNIYRIDLFDEEKDPRTHYIAIHFKSKPTVQELSSCQGVYGLDRNKYTNYLVQKPNYYLLLHILIDIINKTKGKVLIYIGTNDAIFNTREWIIKNYPELAPQIGVYTSLVPKEEKREQLERRIILSTTKSAGAASDIPGLKLTILLNEPFKSEVLARQTLGRTRDPNTMYIEIVDDSFIDIRNYYKHKKSIFATYALSCRDINLVYELESRANAIIERRNSSKPMYTKI